MKNISFRAWDKIRKIMYTGLPYSNAGSDGRDNFPQVLKHPMIYVVMQYIGLTDKNGVRIYEGDIVEFDDVGEEGYEYKEGFDFANRAVVVWNNGRFELGKFLSDNSEVMELMNNCHEDFWNALKDCQVIGNIYDNPDLLNSLN